MTGLNIVIPQAFTDTSLPKLRDDPVLPDAGALFLIEPAHPVNPWPSGVPADGTILPNLTETQALAMIGSATPNDGRPFIRRNAGFTGSAGLLERTGKSGLHGISPQSAAAVPSSGPGIYLSPKVTRYVLQNPTHVYFTSLWARVTRLPLVTSTGLFGVATGDQQSNSNEFYFGLRSDGIYNFRPLNDGDAAFIANPEISPGAPALGPLRVAMQAKDYYRRATNGLPTTPSPSLAAGVGATTSIGWGPSVLYSGTSVGLDGTIQARNGRPSATANTPAEPSWVFYRWYLEDLTVSGRTYAAVSALDQAEYTKQVTTVGGRYYGDTFTDPTTIP